MAAVSYEERYSEREREETKERLVPEKHQMAAVSYEERYSEREREETKERLVPS
jgi:hypothetical protein